MNALAKAQPPRNDDFGNLRSLGDVAKIASDNNHGVPDTVRAAFEQGLKSASPLAQRDAIQGMIKYYDKWGKAELDLIKSNYSFETVKELAQTKDTVLKQHKAALLEGLRDKVTSDDVKVREGTIVALGMLGGRQALIDNGLTGRDDKVVDEGQHTKDYFFVDDKAGTTFGFTIPTDANVHPRIHMISAKDYNRSYEWGDRFDRTRQSQYGGWMGRHVPVNGAFAGVTEMHYGKTLNTVFGMVKRDANYNVKENDTWEWFDNGTKFDKKNPAHRNDPENVAKFRRQATQGDYAARTNTDLGPVPVRGSFKDTDLAKTDAPEPRAVQSADTLRSLVEQARKNPPNQQAVDLIMALGSPCGSGDKQAVLDARIKEVQRLEGELRKTDSASRLPAMELVRKALGGAESAPLQVTLNNARMELLTKGLGPDSSPEQLQIARQNLEKELELARKQGDVPGAQLVNDKLGWLATTQKVQELNNIKPDDPKRVETSKRVMAELSQMAERGNPYAQSVMAMLVNNGDRAAQERTRDLAAEGGALKLPIPELTVLPEADQKTLQQYAIGFLAQKTAITSGALNRAEAEALTVAFQRASKAPPDVQALAVLTDSIDTALRSNLEIPRVGLPPINGREAMLSALAASINRGENGEAFVGRYLAHATNPKQLSADLPAFKAQAEAGNKDAMAVLAGIAAGADSDAAKSARQAMVELAAKPEIKEKLLMAAAQARDAVTGDRKAAMDTFRAMTGTGEVPPSVRQLLHEQLRSNNSSERAGAAGAMVAIADRWTDADLDAIKNNISLESARALKDLPEAVLLKHGEQLRAKMLEVAGKADSTPAQREAAVLALANLGGEKALKDKDALAKGGLTTDTKDGVTTITDKDGTKYQFKFGEKGAARLERLDRADGTFKINKYDNTGAFTGAEEVDKGKNKLLFDRDNRLSEVQKPNGEFLKFNYAQDNKSASIVNSEGRGWDSSDGGRTWSRRGSVGEQAIGSPVLQPDGSLKFSGEKLDVTERPDGVLVKFNKETKETTVVEKDGTSVTKNEGGKVVRTRDINGVEREYFWSPDKKLIGMKDETGVYRADPTRSSWQRVDRPGQPVPGTRDVDDSGRLIIHETGKPEVVQSLDGSRTVKAVNGITDILNRHGDKTSLRYKGQPPALKEVTQSDGRRWKSEDGKSFTLLGADGQPTAVKATFEVGENGTIKRTLEGDSVSDARGVLHKQVEYKTDGTSVALDSQGRLRELVGREKERTTIEYEGATEKATKVTTAYANGRTQTVTLNGPASDRNNIGATGITVDKATGVITATGVKVNHGAGEVARDRLTISGIEGTKAYTKAGDSFQLAEIYRPDGGREQLAWGKDKDIPGGRTVQNGDGSVALLNARGQVRA